MVLTSMAKAFLLIRKQRPYSLGLELAYNTDPPIPHPDDLNPKESVINRQIIKSSYQRWLLASFVLFGILAISIGLGVGLSKRSSPSTTPGTPSEAPPVTPVVNHGAMNDTSLSAIQDTEGNRHLFFQDLNGTLCHILFSKATNSWVEGVNFISSERPPRNLTPISVVKAKETIIATYFNIFYIDDANTIAAVQYSANQSLLPAPYPIINDTFSTSSNTRSLSVLGMRNSTVSVIEPNEEDADLTTFWNQYLLAYEDPAKQITVLNGSSSNYSSSGFGDISVFSWNWNNASTDVNGSYLGDIGGLSGPFSLANESSSSFDQPYNGYFYDPSSVHVSGESTIYEVGFSQLSELGKIPYHAKHIEFLS